MVTVSIERVAVDFGQRAVLRDIQATVRAGEFVGIIGPNGAGKSTLLRAILHLIKPGAGRVLIDGRDVAGLPRRQVAQSLAYLPQGQMLHWPLTVERLVALGRLPYLAPMSKIGAADRAAIAAALHRADVAHLQGRIATELSGGELARVMLARALAVGAKGLLVDEPLTSLDPGHQIDVMRLLEREAQAGALVVAVLHDLTMAARYCSRLLLIDGGQLIADGKPADVLTRERLLQVYGITAQIDMTGAAPMIIPLDRVAPPGAAA
jgi:iron complex transport system ATP-binding protein